MSLTKRSAIGRKRLTCLASAVLIAAMSRLMAGLERYLPNAASA